MDTAELEQQTRHLRAEWQRWGQRHNRDHLEAGRQGMPIVHERCGRQIDRLYLRPDNAFGWWVQVTGSKWTQQHPPGGDAVLRCHPDACRWASKPIPDTTLLAAMMRAAALGQGEIYVNDLSELT